MNSKGYHIYADRFYSSLTLEAELYRMGIHFTGTINLNRRGLPNKIKYHKMKKGEVISFIKDKRVMVLSWKDKRIVTMISNYSSNGVKEIYRYKKGGSTVIVSKPEVVLDYNDNMGGVDNSDHMNMTYAFKRKSVKWWRKLFFWIFNLAIVNSFILFNKEKKSRNMSVVKQKDFRINLFNQLIESVPHNNSKKRRRPIILNRESRLTHNNHFIEKGKNKDCVVCSYRSIPGRRKQTVYYCKTCELKPAMCLDDCFERYHTIKHYRKSIFFFV